MVKINGINYNYYVEAEKVVAIIEWDGENDGGKEANLDIYFGENAAPLFVSCKDDETRKAVIEEIQKIKGGK